MPTDENKPPRAQANEKQERWMPRNCFVVTSDMYVVTVVPMNPAANPQTILATRKTTQFLATISRIMA